LQHSATELGVEAKQPSAAALQYLSAVNWSGNVRQLENVCHWLTVMAPAQVIELKDLPPEVLAMVPAVPAVATEPAPVVVVRVPEEPTPVAAAPAPWAAAAPALPDEAPVPLLALAPAGASSAWESGLQTEALALLEEGRTDVWDVLTRRFETRLIQTALVNTRGRRIEAAQKLGIGRNTITRKIQELNLE
jgi:two-component system nitrogen regulation response regulator GlnG